MSAPKAKPGNRRQNGPVPGTPADLEARSTDVLTLSEAAAFLRVAEKDVLRLAQVQELPGRKISSEWRFLRSGLRDWLLAPTRKSGKEAMLALAGAWQDDPDIEEIVKEALRRRGRLSAENE